MRRERIASAVRASDGCSPPAARTCAATDADAGSATQRSAAARSRGRGSGRSAHHACHSRSELRLASPQPGSNPRTRTRHAPRASHSRRNAPPLSIPRAPIRMASQKLSFDGLEVTPNLSAGLVRANKKKRRFTDAQAEPQYASATAALAASSPAAAAAASSSSSSSSFTPRSISGSGGASASSSSKRSKHSHKKAAKQAAQDAASAEATAREKSLAKEHRARLAKYTEIQGALHGKTEINKVTNSALKKEMKLSDKAKVAHAEAAARAEILLPASQGSLQLSNPLDRTWRLSQDKLKPALDVRTQAKIFDLKMDEFGPYTARYTRNGKFLLLAGRKGHVSLMNYHALSLESESHLKDQVEDACFLHNESMYAVAQRKHVYIYDRTGMELHVLRNHNEVTRLEFLPYHFLLASIGRTGYLKYQDTSTGAFLTEHRTKLGECNVMKQNPSNAVICLGHSNGTVTMWTPNMNQPVVTMLTHRAPLLALGIDIGGNMMASSGLDGQVKIWDIRTYRELHSYFTIRPASTIDVSDQGLLALGFGPHVQVWRDAFRTKQNAPYMVKQIPGQIVKVSASRRGARADRSHLEVTLAANGAMLIPDLLCLCSLLAVLVSVC